MSDSTLPFFRSHDHAAKLQALAREAGSRIMAHRAAATEDTHRKMDGSPVTAADHEAQSVILAGLAALSPDIPVVAEEKKNPESLASTGTYWLVDPLDGTLDFVKGGLEFSVNIGLVVDHRPYLGVIYAPAVDDLFYGEPGNVLRVNKQVSSALHAPTQVKSAAASNLITSRREAKRLPVQEWLRDGVIGAWRVCSSAYKFGLLAAGEYDLFLRTGLTYEWDTAAGDAILRAVGGRIMVTPNDQLAYGKTEFRNGNFVAHGTSWDTTQLSDFITRLEKSSA